MLTGDGLPATLQQSFQYLKSSASFVSGRVQIQQNSEVAPYDYIIDDWTVKPQLTLKTQQDWDCV